MVVADQKYAAPVYPEPEVLATPVEPKDDRVPGGVRTITNLLAKTDGWELVNLTYARGPYVGAKGEVLSISDSIVLRARGPEVDGRLRYAVGSWRDGKFDSAYILTRKPGTERYESRPANASELKAWIKGSQEEPVNYTIEGVV